ncbi:PEGA domain protein [Deinococcus proteolyticus MRP]|uniref:PEGA domain protein n=1 Tax=Deinococcus proteolyticus (strain ATCC 35074 / DSM 20540 / JCM 6276 / NBRC 101906 / NCIMB 13154 / VKM Ac-1939 / CCM 2703 / MRP) TaxID=693977 RepID=F0RLA5_DEIPM|nr:MULTISPECIES: DUF4384 domain-containing protein [Deinococcus]ADY25809.1 PEGA domain protein [Deinococcus proteolyticus MRP]MCY1701932.1 DUF4384 domain-containing protein [Deinococcus sp. SL84]
MNKTIKAALLPMTLLAGSAGAQTISAQSIIVNPTQPDLSVQVNVDKDTTGNAVPTYRVGEGIRLSVKTNRDAYVYLFNVDAAGKVSQILPNRLDQGDSFVRANTVKTFPPANAAYTFDVEGPAGLNKVLALASLNELSLNDISRFATAQSQFADVNVNGQERLAQALSIVVNPLPQNSWVSDTAFFDVAERTPVRTGSLFVGTNVNNASIILNGRVLGGANRTYTGIAPGSYPVRIAAPGFADFRTTVNIASDRTTNLNVDFRGSTAPAPVTPVAGSYNVTVRSSLNGGRVFMNGNEVGTIRNGQVTASVPRGQYQIVIVAPNQPAEIATINVNRDGGINLSQAPRTTTINLLDLLFR